MTHYDREGVGVRPIMMYDNDREGGLKDLDIMLNLSKKYIKRGMFLPGNTKIPLYYCEFG